MEFECACNRATHRFPELDNNVYGAEQVAALRFS